MADNYLENRMEAYRSGRLSRQSRSTAAMRRPARPDTLTLLYPELTVAVSAEAFTPLLGEVVAAFRSVGAQVSFCSPQAGNEATLLAQRSGTRYYPAPAHSRATMLADLTERKETPDFVIDLVDNAIAVSCSDLQSVPVAVPSSASPGSVARLLLFLAHPSNSDLL